MTPKTIDEWAAENGYEKNKWGNYPNTVVAAYEDYTKNFKTGNLPNSPNVTNPLPKPENYANEHKMDDQKQYEHDVQVANPISALARKEEKDKENLKEAADLAGIETEKDKEILSGIKDLFDNGKTAHADTSNVENTSNNIGSESTSKESINETTNGENNSNISYSGDYSTTNAHTNHYAPMSIMQAYYAGCFGDPNSEEAKASRNYFLGDTIATFIRNLGKDVGNVGAQYSGGTIDNNRDSSKWDSRNAEMLKQGVSSEAATVQGSDKDIERQLQNNVINSGKLSNEQKNYIVNASREIDKLLKKAQTNEERILLSQIQSQLATGNVNQWSMIGGVAAGGLTPLKELGGALTSGNFANVKEWANKYGIGSK